MQHDKDNESGVPDLVLIEEFVFPLTHPFLSNFLPVLGKLFSPRLPAVFCVVFSLH